LVSFAISFFTPVAVENAADPKVELFPDFISIEGRGESWRGSCMAEQRDLSHN